ncbi:MAG TPA: hypothetical protein VHO70_02305 [Chitinispirillaceae bacterium]|nr:hypothetical protein [Chitinispirillaceae bacterium]
MIHILNVATIIDKFLPTQFESENRHALNGVELTFLLLAILLHDVGMFVSDADEKQTLLDSKEYQSYLRLASNRLETANKAEAAGLTVRAGAIRDAIFAEFIRRKHAERVRDYIKKYLNDKLRFRGSDFSSEIADLCASHAWGIQESNSPLKPGNCVKKLDIQKMIGATPVNLSYIACCLRLGDILDFDRTRTPVSAFYDIHFTEDLSVQEWNKHLSIEGRDINQYGVLFETKCKTPSDYVAVHNFLGWVDKELQECTRLVHQFPGKFQERYRLNIASLTDRTKVQMKNPDHIAGAFRFQLEYDQIMRLLMDKSLYPDPALFLRELLQNALDACRYQKALAEDLKMADKYIPRIQVHDLSGLPRNPEKPLEGPRIIFRDNGIGMSQEQVEKYFMRVGKSFYRSVEFKAEVERLKEKGIFLDACSQFGIGFLSCFMGGDLIEVVTYRHGCQPLKITIEGPGKYFIIERLNVPPTPIPYNSPENPEEDTPPYHPGTCVTVHLREDWHGKDKIESDDIVFKTLNTFAVNQEFAVMITTAQSKQSRIISARRWENEIPNYNCDSKTDELIKSFLAPAIFKFVEIEPMLHGIGIIWMLSDEGNPDPHLGFLQCGKNEHGKYEVTFISAIREFLMSVLEQHFGDKRDRKSRLESIKSAISLLIQSPEKTWMMLEEINNNNSINRKKKHIKLAFTNLKLLFPDFNIAEKSRIQTMLQLFIDNLPSRFMKEIKLSIEEEELFALVKGDLVMLSKAWLDKGISEWDNSLFYMSEYCFALHGIEAPGGFQTWEPDIGEANRHNWLPGGTSAFIDTYGQLSPQPAANRLFVPLEKSIVIQNLVTRAFIRYANKLRNEHSGDPIWHNWFKDFLYNWDNDVLYSAIRDEDFNLLVDALMIKYITKEGKTEWLSPMDLCCRFDTLRVKQKYHSDSGFEDIWWLPGFAEAEYDAEGMREVDLAPLAARLGIKKVK